MMPSSICNDVDLWTAMQAAEHESSLAAGHTEPFRSPSPSYQDADVRAFGGMLRALAPEFAAHSLHLVSDKVGSGTQLEEGFV